MTLIKSINDDQKEIMRHICELFNQGRPIEIDPCYNKGNIWKGIEKIAPAIKFDLQSLSDDVKTGDCTNLPIENNSVGSVFFDPPFIVNNTGNCFMQNRYTSFPTPKSLWEFYDKAIAEFSRILKKHGLLVVKCQPVCTSQFNLGSHFEINNLCIRHGFEWVDEFILTAKSRPYDPNLKQRHARKFHCYFLVFKKRPSKVKHTNPNLDVKKPHWLSDLFRRKTHASN